MDSLPQSFRETPFHWRDFRRQQRTFDSKRWKETKKEKKKHSSIDFLWIGFPRLRSSSRDFSRSLDVLEPRREACIRRLHKLSAKRDGVNRD